MPSLEELVADRGQRRSHTLLGRQMVTERYQDGRVVLVGKHLRKCRGHFYVYQHQADASEVRRFRSVHFGLKSDMDKGNRDIAPGAGCGNAPLILRDSVSPAEGRAVEGNFALQGSTYFNELAPKFCKGVLTKIRVHLNSILDEAVELESGSEAGSPRALRQKVTGVHLTPEQIPVVLF